ncbi:MAG TPA: hypothetical protein DDZ88_31455 [Verrucomicrobiales bacterium]|nr:hypothetical protein [Verrucomicrobiales bacterium]
MVLLLSLRFPSVGLWQEHFLLELPQHLQRRWLVERHLCLLAAGLFHQGCAQEILPLATTA